MNEKLKRHTEKFAKKFNIPVFNYNSVFPKYYSVHCFYDLSLLEEEYLFSADVLKKYKNSYEIDKILGTTNYVFFLLVRATEEGCNFLIYSCFYLYEK